MRACMLLQYMARAGLTLKEIRHGLICRQKRKQGRGYMYFLLVLNLIVPFVMILVGYLFRKHPVADMDSHNGYNTPVSRISQKHWDYAQSIAPDIFIGLGKTAGVTEIILSLVLMLLRISVHFSIAAGEVVGIGFLLWGFYKTDTKIEEKFGSGTSNAD